MLMVVDGTEQGMLNDEDARILHGVWVSKYMFLVAQTRQSFPHRLPAGTHGCFHARIFFHASQRSHMALPPESGRDLPSIAPMP